MPIRSVVQNDRRRPKGHQQVELGREYDGPDALQYSLHNRVQVPGRDHARPQHAVGHIQAVRLESPHLDLMILHHLGDDRRGGVGRISSGRRVALWGASLAAGGPRTRRLAPRRGRSKPAVAGTGPRRPPRGTGEIGRAHV